MSAQVGRRGRVGVGYIQNKQATAELGDFLRASPSCVFGVVGGTDLFGHDARSIDDQSGKTYECHKHYHHETRNGATIVAIS